MPQDLQEVGLRMRFGFHCGPCSFQSILGIEVVNVTDVSEELAASFRVETPKKIVW
jgi:hypothetical protein